MNNCTECNGTKIDYFYKTRCAACSAIVGDKFEIGGSECDYSLDGPDSIYLPQGTSGEIIELGENYHLVKMWLDDGWDNEVEIEMWIAHEDIKIESEG